MRLPLLSSLRNCPRPRVVVALPPSPAFGTASVAAGTRARCNDGACLRTAHCASCESQSPRIRSSMLAPMPLYAFLQAATSYQDSRRSSYDTRRLGGPLVFFPPAPPGALLLSLSPEAAPSTIASSPTTCPASARTSPAQSQVSHLILHAGKQSCWRVCSPVPAHQHISSSASSL